MDGTIHQRSPNTLQNEQGLLAFDSRLSASQDDTFRYPSVTDSLKVILKDRN